MKGERILFHIAPGWTLAADRQQWILLEADKTALEGGKNLAGARFRPVAFIGGAKETLRRILRKNHVTPTPEGRAALDALPDSFKASRPKATTAAAPAIRRAA